MHAGGSLREGLGRAFALCVLVALGVAAAAPFCLGAEAAGPVSRRAVPILIVDGGLGDSRFYITHWLGTADDVAKEGSVRLLTSSAPIWWGDSPGVPDTYLLTTSSNQGEPAAEPLSVAQIAWALDRIAERHPAGKTVLVAQGASGLTARRYLQDLGRPKQSDRADVVGLVLLGTPNAGLELMEPYPDLDVWGPYAAGAGMDSSDLMPGSAFLTELDSAPFPAIVQVAAAQGIVVSLAGRETDGIAARGDSRIATGVVSGVVDYVPLRARASEAWPLEQTWHSETKQGGATVGQVDDEQVQRLGLARGYSTSPEVMEFVRTFYSNWFAEGAPTTHISTRLVVDTSGSMAQHLGSRTKLETAVGAATTLLDALDARGNVRGAVPEDVGLVVFSEEADLVAHTSAGTDTVRDALEDIVADGHTDVGLALTEAIASFGDSPAPAEKTIVFLSDGVSTVGLDTERILAGPVAEAIEEGIRIETFALGSVEQADIDFLENVADRTGASFHEASDLFELQRGFLRARYVSLGDLQLDVEQDLASAAIVDLGMVATGARLLEIGILSEAEAPTWSVLLNGTPLEGEAALEVLQNGQFLSIALVDPEPGEYTLELGSTGSRAHVFAVQQVNAFLPQGTAAIEDDLDLLLLAGGGGLAVLGVFVTILLAVRGRKTQRAPSVSEEEEVLVSRTIGEDEA